MLLKSLQMMCLLVFLLLFTTACAAPLLIPIIAGAGFSGYTLSGEESKPGSTHKNKKPASHKPDFVMDSESPDNNLSGLAIARKL